MAWLIIEIENIKEAGINTTEHKEIEGIIFKADDGKEKRYKLKGMITQSTSYMRTIIPEVDWDESNAHIAVLLGEEIKV